MESQEIVQKSLKDQLSSMQQKLNAQTSQTMNLIDTKLITLNDTLSISLSHLTKKTDSISQIDQRTAAIEKQLKALFPSNSVLTASVLSTSVHGNGS
jgi:hypothetical protein